MFLSWANTYTGTTTVSAGVLNIQNNTALGTGAGGTTVTTNAALQMQGGITVTGEALTLNGTGVSNDGALRNISDNNTWTGAVTLGSATRINSDAGTLTISGNIGGNTQNLTVGGAGNTSITGIIGTTSGTLTKDGAGILTLTNANTYTGATTINAGTLAASVLANGSANSSIGASSNVASNLVISGGTLQYTGGAVSSNRLFTLGTTGTLDASGTGALNLTGTGSMGFVSSGTRTLTLTGSNTGNNTVAAVIGDNGGATSLTKSGSGTWVLSGTNTYTGATTVSGGILTIGADNNLGAAPGSATAGSLNLNGGTLQTSANVTLNNNRGIALGASGGTLDVNSGTTLTYGGIIAGTGSLTKADSGTLVLSGANTYTGTTSISAGVLNIQNNAALGAGGATVATGAALQMQNNITVTGESLTLNDGGIATDGALRNVSGTNTWTGTVTLGSASRINSDAGTLTLSGAIGGATQNLTVGGSGNTAISGVIGTTTGSLTKEGAGMLTLSGANAYTGTTTISAGVLNIQNADALGTASNTSTTTVANGAVLQIANNITTTNKGTLILNGSGTGSGALQNVSGNNTWNSAITLASDATVFSSAAGSTLNLSTDYATAYTLTMGNHTLTIDGPGNVWANANVGVAGDTGGLIKNGTGKLTFYGYNTFYTGATVVNAGSLDLIVGPFTPGWYGINGALTIGTGPSNPALAGTVNVNIQSNSYTNQISPTSAVTINSDGALNVGASTGLGSLTLNGGQMNISTGVSVTPSGDITSNTNSAHETSLISGGALNLTTGNINVTRDSTLASDLTISSAIGGTNLAKNGSGILTLSGANSYSGTTSVNAGVVNIQNNTALGTGAGGTTVAAGAALQMQGGITVTGEALTLNGTGVSSDGALRNISGNNTWTGAVTLGSATRINSDAGTLAFSGGISGAGQNLTIGGAGNTSVSGGIGITTGTLTKDGAGALTLGAGVDLTNGSLVLSGGKFVLGAGTTTFSSLSVTANSILDFNSAGNSALNILNSLSVSSSATLTIQNWSDAADYFYYLGTSANLTNLSRIVFNGFSGSDTKWLSFDHQITPVPEPATYGAALLGLSTLLAGWRRFRRGMA